MYLSRLILNPLSRRVQREIAAPYELHRTVMRAFPAKIAPGSERVLYRLEAQPRFGGVELLVQSRGEPDWAWLAAAGARGYLLELQLPNPDVKAFRLGFVAGQSLAFRLRANPTRKLAPEARPEPDRHSNGWRVGLYKEAEQTAWLSRKAEAGGFRLLHVQVRSEGVAQAAKRGDDDGERQTLKLLAVTFEGLLMVTDTARFVETVEAGIGSAKGLGFGLLSLARAT